VIGHWDGNEWSSQADETIPRLLDVRGTASDNVWAVGADEDSGVILHWDGTDWAVDSRVEHIPTAVWSIDADDVWVAVADYSSVEGNGYFLHWDGRMWHQLLQPKQVWTEDVWGTSSDDVWAVGNAPNHSAGSILHWNGCSWLDATHATGSVPLLFALWGSAPGNLLAVGANAAILRR
jgi:hypothetical protein